MATMTLEQHAGVSREDILKFPFPYKLWIVISLPTATFLYWNSDGTVIQINLPLMQEYLHSSHSIFIIKTSANFLQHLKDFQFNRLDGVGTGILGSSGSIELSYKHENFQRHRLDLVAKIRRVVFFNLDNAQNAELEASQNAPSTSTPRVNRMRGDLCFMEHGTLTEIQRKRIQSEIVFNFTRESKVLQEKLKKADEKINVGNGKRGRSVCLEREQVVVLPKDLHENPYDSVLAGKGFQGYRYGGYYGNCTVEQIDNFFGDYLPKYGEGGVLHVKKFKESAENNGQNEKSLEEMFGGDSGIAVDETTTTESSVTVAGDHFMEVDSLITNTSNEASNLTDASNINISASFNCSSGAVEYNVTDYSNNDILVPPYEALNVIAVNPLNQINSPIAPTVPATIEPNQKQDENTDFYDDLRATFELLQNQSY